MYAVGSLINSLKTSNLGTYAEVSRGSLRDQKSVGFPSVLFFFIALLILFGPALYAAIASSQSPSNFLFK